MSGRKRGAGNGVMQQQGQKRKTGSSFWTCPACNIAVHSALMAFHISSCPVVGANEVPAPMKSKGKPLPPDRRLRSDKEKRVQEETGQSSPMGNTEFTCAMKRKVSLREEDVLQEEQEQPLIGSLPSASNLSVDVGTNLLSCPNPETPVLEGRDRIGVDMGKTVSPSSPPAEVRKRLFEDWGDQLSPKPPEFVVQDSAFPKEAVAAPFLLYPQAKRSRVAEFDESRIVVDLGLTDLGSSARNVAEGETLRYLDSVHDSQQERHGEDADALDCTEKGLHENITECDQKLHASNLRSLEVAAKAEHENGFSQRELQLENVIRELKEKYSWALLRETKLQETLDLRNEECEILHRHEQELQSELFSVRGQLENALQELKNVVDKGEQKSANEIHGPVQSATQVYAGDESMATQPLSDTSITPASHSNSPRARKDELLITRVSSVSSQDLMKAHNRVDIANEEQATQLFSDGLDLPDMDEGEESQASAEFRRVSGPRACPSDVELGEPSALKAAPGKVDESLAQRLFAGTETNKRILNDECSRRLPLSMNAAAVLAPHTPGKALLKPTGEQEERDAFGGLDSCNLHANQPTEVTPGGGPKTPENFAVMLLRGQEKGLIGEMLNSFPPAQGMTHVTVDPFDEHFSETVNESSSNVRNASIDDGQKFMSDGVDDKIRLRHERIDECQPPALPQAFKTSQEESTDEIAWKKKRRKPALVIDSDSDGDIGKRADPIVEVLKDRHLFSSAPVNVILSSDEEDFCEGSAGSGTKRKRRRLIKVQESPDGTKTLPPDLDSEGAKEIGGEEFKRRRSERMRNTGRREGLGSRGQGSPAKFDGEVVEIDSDSSDGGQIGSLQKPRMDIIANQKNRYSRAQRALFVGEQDAEDEEIDDIDSDDTFINDDLDSEADLVDEISDSSQESETDGSSLSRSSSEERKKYNWDLEGDMLAALGKDKELCLRGLCAIYRRQEEDEKYWASSKYRNKRGFSNFHSARASMVASFLMGDTNIGPVVKTVKELKDEWSEATVTYCSDMCNHYSKQLFEIYVNKEDPYFPGP